MTEQVTKNMPILKRVGSFFTPNAHVGAHTLRVYLAVTIISLIALWSIGPGVFPTPIAVWKQLVEMITRDGLIGHLLMSLQLSIEAIVLSSIIALSLAYLSTSAPMRGLIDILSAFRFLSLVGTGIFFMPIVGAGHAMKLSMLVFSMTTFILSTMKAEVQQVSDADLDYVRSLRCSPWRVVIEAQVMGTSGKAFDTIIDTAAMAWMTLTAVEGIVRTEGGIGALLLSENRHYNIAGIIAVQLVFLTAGIVQDSVLRMFKGVLLPHTKA